MNVSIYILLFLVLGGRISLFVLLLYTLICNSECVLSAIDLSSRIVAKAFYVGELESELQRIGKIDYHFHLDSDLEKCMEMVESVHREPLYPHPPHMCTEECKKKG